VAGPALLISLTTDPPIQGMVFALDKAAENVSDFHPLLMQFGDIFKRLMTEQFASEGSLAGGWAGLSTAYETWKSEHYPGRPIGVLEGHLRSAMTGGSGYTQHVGSSEADYGLGGGPATVYGKYFSHGTDKMPARPVVKWGTAQTREFQKSAHEWLHHALEVAAGH
jgi:phage gpG-like protein